MGNYVDLYSVIKNQVSLVSVVVHVLVYCNSITLFVHSFKLLCEDAFLRLREHGALFLNLFTMMLSCGIPELRTKDDIYYIR